MAMTTLEISKLTEDNCSTEAYIQGCLYLGLTEKGYMIKALREIEERQMDRGYLSAEDNITRYALYKDMINLAKLSMGRNEYNDFYNCF